MLSVSISLVVHNQWNDLERLLPSLLPAVELVDGEILLVDNRSVDGTAEYIRESFPSVKLVCNPNKAGYGTNHNLNLRLAQGRYFAIMNADMTVVRNIFVVLREFMDRHPNVGIVAPKILNADGTIQGLNKRYPTIWDLFLRRFVPKSMQSMFQSRIDYYEMRDVGYDRECEVPSLSGCFMFCRADLLKAIEGFDERYFLYFEDFDLCRRVQKTHRTVYYPEVAVTHFWARAAHKSSAHAWYFFRSALCYFNLWGYRIF